VSIRPAAVKIACGLFFSAMNEKEKLSHISWTAAPTSFGVIALRLVIRISGNIMV